jgi:hypothetical protein
MVGEIDTNGNITYVYVFAGVALFILLIACFNFTNPYLQQGRFQELKK